MRRVARNEAVTLPLHDAQSPARRSPRRLHGRRPHPDVDGDGRPDRRDERVRRPGAAAAHRVLHPPVLLPRDRQSPRLAGRQPPGSLGAAGPHRRGPHRRAHGAVRLRGHGIPEALEAILIGQSRMSARVAVLKPLSTAISIGTGGPFGAEGPIIMTGGAFGSLFGQAFHLSPGERKTLLVAGAAGGMAAVFGTPLAAALLAVELLLFEWKPRSFIPVACAAAVAGALRVPLLGTGPL